MCRSARLGLWVWAAAVAGCLPDNPDRQSSSTGASAGGDLGAVLGCPDKTCHLLLVSQTLDDRVEIFAPDDPEGIVYRGAIDLDLEPNACAGCGLGDYAADRLDEPYGLTLAGGHLHVVLGHYPSMEAGSLVSFPVGFFAELAAGDTVPKDAYFAAGAFAGVVATPLEQLEPIFVTPVADKLLIGTFNNNLFSAEDGWDRPGRVLVLDAEDPSAGIGVVELDALQGGSCDGAGQIVVTGAGMLAVACDGNEAVARLLHGDLAGVSPADAAATFSGSLCYLPGAVSNRRVRYLAADASGGFVVAEGPTPLDLLGDARLWHFDPQCQVQGTVTLPDDGDWQLGDLVVWPASEQTWLFASGSATTAEHRGVFVLRQRGDALEHCGPIGGFEGLLVDAVGDPLQPVALAATADGRNVAVGAGPLMPPVAGPGFGRVLWASLPEGDDPCAMPATVVDLTAGGAGAPTVDPVDPATFRRAPNAITLVEVDG